MKKALTAALAACTLTLGISPAHAQEVELTFSTYLPPAYEYAWKPIENFVQNVEKESQGRIKINVFHSGQLFDGYEELPALSRGDVDIINMTSTYPSGYHTCAEHFHPAISV
jgi:TRAP-type C4-dicarboxylate transport system substrate-binding protein